MITNRQIAAMMRELGQKRYVVKPAAEVYRDGREQQGNTRGYVVCDTAHQDRVMSGVLALDVAKGWAYSEHESWARRLLQGGKTVENCYLIDNEWEHGSECDCGAPEGD